MGWGQHPYWGSSLHYQQCLTGPVVPSIMTGGVFSAIDAFSGHKVTMRSVGMYAGGIYVYNIVQCPMEAIHGRQSAIHNVTAGALLGYIAVSSGALGIPFVDQTLFWRHPRLSPPIVGAGVYGTMGGLFAALGGKRL
eukprot:CAMPEP_0183309518 /NCGR_PEP_ID=MMETSP0160_2-20130417/25392_1 /TAXON_ID=2839 ORGANISM="Odontella Sinensis, Strain Grunow 1884" /NCGR_SAMPLE_ID=MMETSP0160_2 /ASSEMBLY_ACC=CAM_ASM_000250 /LENGTH=136 /DNA_ID=CAMNT_0025473559 /DNA_START=13 /DNA_END=423 /DNA_ORIENTATION=-